MATTLATLRATSSGWMAKLPARVRRLPV
ncbi:hypothetical protein SMALA_6337 [Streptomyces malaysiensis subsp. malaysiensis]|nr:hypothetical protein SMALA_6337 [Streptomyces malaysiensis]